MDEDKPKQKVAWLMRSQRRNEKRSDTATLSVFKYEEDVFLLDAEYLLSLVFECSLLQLAASLHSGANILWHTDLPESLHDVDAVLHNLSHRHLVALQDRFDGSSLTNAV